MALFDKPGRHRMPPDEKYEGRHRGNAGRHRDLSASRAVDVGRNAKHEPTAGKHRANAGRHVSLGGYTPLHAPTAKSHNKRSKTSMRDVKSRQPGLGTALQWIWDLGKR